MHWHASIHRLCCDRKSRAACVQSFALWQQATIEFTCHDHSIIACSRNIYVWCCSSRTSRLWCITHLMQCHRRGCNTWYGNVADVSHSSIWVYRQHLLIKTVTLLFSTDCSQTQLHPIIVIQKHYIVKEKWRFLHASNNSSQCTNRSDEDVHHWTKAARH